MMVHSFFYLICAINASDSRLPGRGRTFRAIFIASQIELRIRRGAQSHRLPTGRRKTAGQSALPHIVALTRAYAQLRPSGGAHVDSFETAFGVYIGRVITE